MSETTPETPTAGQTEETKNKNKNNHMTTEQQASITSNVQAAGKFLSEANLQANNVLYCTREDLDRCVAEFKFHILCAHAHLEGAVKERQRIVEIEQTGDAK